MKNFLLFLTTFVCVGIGVVIVPKFRPVRTNHIPHTIHNDPSTFKHAGKHKPPSQVALNTNTVQECKKMLLEIYPYQFVAVNEYSALLAGTVGNTAEESLERFKREWKPEGDSMMGVCIVQFIPQPVIGKPAGYWYKGVLQDNPK